MEFLVPFKRLFLLITPEWHDTHLVESGLTIWYYDIYSIYVCLASFFFFTLLILGLEFGFAPYIFVEDCYIHFMSFEDSTPSISQAQGVM